MGIENVVFLSEFSENNVKIGNILCENGSAGYWLGPSPIDYDLIKSDCGSLFTNPKEESFKTFIASFIWDLGYSPDLLVIKGNTVDFWGVASLIGEGVFDFPCISLLDDLVIPIAGYDLMVLDQFDKNIIKPKQNILIRNFLDIFRKEFGEECENYEVLKNIVEKTIPMKEFPSVFGNDIEEEYFEVFIEEFKSKVLNEINRGMSISGAVII